MNAASLALHRGQEAAARTLLETVRAQGRVAWNRRRAAATLLHLDVNAFQNEPWADAVTPGRADELVGRANALIADADKARDLMAVAAGNIRRYQVENHMADLARARSDSAAYAEWYQKSFASRQATLAADDLHPEAVCQFASEMVGRLWGRSETTAHDLTFGGLAEQARRRAVELTRTRFHGSRPFHRQLEVALFAAMLSLIFDDTSIATEMGAIANHVFDDLPAPRQAEMADKHSLLDDVRRRLDLEVWPAPK